MKKYLGLIGIAAACGACCAFPLALPMLGGLAASSLGFTFGWATAALAGIAAVVLVVMLARRRAKASSCATAAPEAANRGCSSTCATGKRGVA
jgi:hypothetical protein